MYKMDIHNIENGHFLVLGVVLFAVVVLQQKYMFIANLPLFCCFAVFHCNRALIHIPCAKTDSAVYRMKITLPNCVINVRVATKCGVLPVCVHVFVHIQALL